MSFKHLLYAYLIGGVTFIPFILIAFIWLHPKKPKNEPTPPLLKAGAIEELALSGLNTFKQGWITLTQEYLESLEHISSKAQPITESPEAKSAYASLYKLVKNSNPNASQTPGESTTEASNALEQPIHSGNPKTPAKTQSNRKHRYFAVLKHGNLFLYNNEKLKNVKHVIVLSNYMVCLWPRKLSEGSLFTKYSAIAIFKKDWSRSRRLSDNMLNGDNEWKDDTKITIEDVMDPESNLPAPPGSFFMHTDVNIDKEDWYFALIRATKTDEHGEYTSLDPRIYAKTLHFETESMVSLIQKLYSSEGQLHSKWFNAIVGRLFLSLQHTDFMKNYLVTRIEKKLNKIKMPGFFDKFHIIDVRPGDGAPFFTFPVLKEINPEGDLVVSMYMHYFGGMSIQISTKMTLSLGSRFKNREVDVLLSMTLEKIQGPMLIKMKSPPSSRLWYTFEQEPVMSVKIEPVISSRQMSYNIITNSIEKKLKESVKESLVLPHWDDLSFYDTSGELYRGGIWDKEARNANQKEEQEEEMDLKQDAEDIDQDQDDFSLIGVSTEDDAESVKFSSASVSYEDFNAKSSKINLGSTFGNLSKRLRKAKSNHSIGVDETNCLSDGSLEHKSGILNDNISLQYATNMKNSTLKKLGNWYSKEDKLTANESMNPQLANYTPPEMISNRRRSRKSISTLGSGPEAHSEQMQEPEVFTYDFGSEINDTGIIPQSIEPNVDESAILSDAPYATVREIEMLEEVETKSSKATPTNLYENVPLHEKLGTIRRKPPPDNLFED